MSWITPIKNTFIKFIVKGNGSGGGGGGIDEETLNAKLAQFYATTETKILNLVNQKLADYVLLTAFNELEAKVNTNTTNIATNTTNISTNTTDINTLKQKVASLESTPIGGSYLEFVSFKIPYSVIKTSTSQVPWEKLWENKEVTILFYINPTMTGITSLVPYLENKMIISIVDAYFVKGKDTTHYPFRYKEITYTSLSNSLWCSFQGNINLTAYTQSNPYSPEDNDYCYISLIVSNPPSKLTESTENGITIKKGGV